MSKRKNVRLIGFRLNDTTALIIYIIGLFFIIGGGIGILTTVTLDINISYLIFYYIIYGLNFAVGVMMLLKAIQYRKIRK